MDAKELLQKAKLFFAELMAPAEPPAPAAPTEYEVKGGGKCTIDKLEAGGIVMIDGNPALPGDLELADGTKVTVGDNGVITAVEAGTPAGDPPPPPPPAFDAQTKFTELEQNFNGKLSTYDTRFAAQETQLAEMKVSLGKANQVIEKLLELSTIIVENPAAAPDPAAKLSGSFKEEKGNDFLENLAKNLK